MMKKLNIRKLYKAAALLILLVSSALLPLSCTGRGGAAGQGNLIYWSSNNTDEIIFARQTVEGWNRTGKGRSIQFQPVPEGQSSEEVILAAVVGGTTPDIYSNMWQGDVEMYARAGKLIALDNIPGFMEFLKERCDSSVIEEIRSTDGHIYQIPWKINPIMLIYNTKMFSAAGFEKPPVTYSDFFRAAENIKRVDESSGYTVRWIGYAEVLVTWWQRFFDFYPIYLAASGGGHLVVNNRAAFNNKYAVETFRFLKTLFDRGYFPRERISARRDPFLGGDIATRFTGPWEIAHAEKFKPAGFEFSFTGIPVPDNFRGNRYTYCDPKNIVLFKTCRDPEGALKFIKHMLSSENDLNLLKITAQLPRRKDLLEDPNYNEYFRQNPRMIVFAEQAKHVRGPDICPVLKEVFDAISQEYEACVVYGKKSPEQAVSDAARAVDLILLQ
ncbi:MAG: extracellular solute-binding protein [Syntrophothermus sp.]